FTFAERKVEITLFLFGFAVLWASLIVLGTFLRGPNWNFFGPFEYWDIHKLEALTNVNLSQYIWVGAFRSGLPSFWLLREIFGILIVVLYVFVLPVVLARRWFKGYFDKLGAPRYYVTVFLFLMMMALPIKMLARWIFKAGWRTSRTACTESRSNIRARRRTTITISTTSSRRARPVTRAPRGKAREFRRKRSS